MNEQVDPTLLVLFGITGDLSRRMLLPALVRLDVAGVLPEAFRIVGVSRSGTSKEKLLAGVREFYDGPDEHIESLLERLSVVAADPTEPECYRQLQERLAALEEEAGVCTRRIFYLATPPSALKDILTTLGEAGIDSCAHNVRGRVLIEKPFGTSLSKAEELAGIVRRLFDPEQVFPIDHFLAKETVQNLLFLRFKNPLLRHIWRAPFVSQIQITAAEEIDIEGRVEFFEETGILLDMVQSHLLQILAITTMEEPHTMEGHDIRENRLRLLKHLQPIAGDDVRVNAVRGQYEGYRDEVGNPESTRETFAALRLHIRNDRWSGVPIYLRTGKALERGYTEVSLIFEDNSVRGSEPNVLTVRMRPNEGVVVTLEAKEPGLGSRTQPITMDYCYAEDGDTILHEAYDKVLVDGMSGNQTLFPSVEEALANWRFIDPIVHEWNARHDDLEAYPKGSEGPAGADRLLEGGGHAWVPFNPAVCRVPPRQ